MFNAIVTVLFYAAGILLGARIAQRQGWSGKLRPGSGALGVMLWIAVGIVAINLVSTLVPGTLLIPAMAVLGVVMGALLVLLDR